MAGVPLGELVSAAGATQLRGDPQLDITGVQYDSRLIKRGDLFVALKGGYVDGHQFLTDALSRGAVAALVEDEAGAEEYRAAAIVENTRAALSPLAAHFYGYPGASMGIIGVTGTDGKTTTSYLIDAMLRANDLRTGLIGTVSVRIGDRVVEHDTRQTTPESLEIQRLLSEMRDESVDWAVIEATSHALSLYRLNDCPFDIGVITNVTREHLDFHGTVEAYREAKAQLIRRVERHADRPFPTAAIINHDDEGARNIGRSASVPVSWFTTQSGAGDISAEDIRVHSTGTSFRLTVAGEHADVDLKLIGSYNVLNAMAAAGVGQALGLSLEQIRAGLESLTHVPGRMQRVDCGQPFGVIVDYAHSPASLEETLRLIRSVTTGKVIVVSGSAGERDRGKRSVQGGICVRNADFAIFTSEDPRFEDPDQIIQEIGAGAEEAGALPGVDFELIEDRRSAIAAAIARAREGDSVLLAGKGHETCMIYGDKRVPWNESQEAELALRDYGFEHLLTSDSEGYA